MSNPFTARWAGRCADCGERYEVGDLLRYEADEPVHVECPDVRLPRLPEQVCPRCWLVQPCGCQDDD